MSSALDGWIDVCRAGTWRDMVGREVALTVGDLDGYVAAHAAGDPAPVVVGHPEHDSPAYAWVDGLRRVGDRLQAKLRDIEPTFRAAVEGGRYATRSIAVSRGRVRHLGFLGGRAPAVEGLAPTQFAAAAERIVEFAASDLAGADRYIWTSLARILRGLRDRIIETDGTEAADRVISGYDIETISEAARDDDADPVAVAPAMASDLPTATLEPDMKTPPTEPAGEAADAAALAQRETALAAREDEIARREALVAADAALEEHVRAGRVLPAERAGLAALLASLPGDEESVLRFAAADGESEVTRQPGEVLAALLAALPSRVPYGELANGDVPAAERPAGFTVPAGYEVDPAAGNLHDRAVALAAERDIAYIQAAAELAAAER